MLMHSRLCFCSYSLMLFREVNSEMEFLSDIHVCQERDCAKRFDSEAKLKSHLRKFHRISSRRVCQTENQRYCDFTGCGWTGHKSGLTVHFRNVHGVVQNNPDVFVVRCPYCTRDFRSHRHMVDHYKETHDPHITIQSTTIDSWSNFKNWCEGMRSSDCIDLVARRGRDRAARSHTVYCSRSGLGAEVIPEQITTSMPRRSVRAGLVCIGFATATELDSGAIQVVFCSNHTGHDLSDCWMRLTKQEKEYVVGLLKDDRSKDYILRSIGERTDLPQFSRLRYVNKADLVYYDKLYNPLRYRLSPEDLESVRERVNSDQDGIFFAFELPRKDSGEGFQLGIMTVQQRNMLLAHAAKGIAFDSTHNVTRYMFKLVSAVVYDEQGRSQPVGHFLCFAESERDMLPFFEHLKRCLGGITPKLIISDDCLAFLNAFNKAFGPETAVQHIICTWHVVRSWNRRLTCEIKDRQEQKLISKYLSELIKSNDERIVRENIGKLLSYLDTSNVDGAANFAKYFRDNYTCPERMRKWAPCYRMLDVANTNMGIERFHRTLKEKYLSNRENKRLDESIEGVIRCANDRALRNVGQERGQTFGNYRTLKTHKNHKQGMLDYVDRKERIVPIDSEYFNVISSTDPNITYKVRSLGQCSCPASARCRACGVCFENYLCNCPAGTQAGVSCKHVHAVHTFYGVHDRSVVLTVANAPDRDDVIRSERNAASREIRDADEREKTLDLIDKLQDILDSKRSEIESLNSSALREMQSKLNAMILSVQTLEPREHLVGRPKRAPQQRSQLSKRVALTKARREHERSSSPEMTETQIKACLNCFKRYPSVDAPPSESQGGEWVECLLCDDLIHKLCYNSDFCCNCD